jgi:hypothetical protein
MERALHHFPAKQPREDAHAAEENREPNIEQFNDGGENARVFFDVAANSAGALQRVGCDNQNRREREQINPSAATRKKVLLQIKAQHRPDLPPPQRPRLIAQLLDASNCHAGAHAVPPSEPMRY